MEVSLVAPGLQREEKITAFLFRSHSKEWTTDGMSWIRPSSYDGTTLECFASTGGGSYSAVYIPVKLEATLTSTSITTTKTMLTTLEVTVPVEVQATDGGMVFGVVLASIALIVVVAAIGWQLYVGNVKCHKPETPGKLLQQVSERCQRLKEMRKPAKVGIEPAPGTPSETTGGKQAQTDAQDHFWDWANDLIKSSSKEETPTPTQREGQAFAKPKVSSPPTLPPRFPARKPAAEKEEYFQSFAQELREMVSAGIPGMTVDSHPADVVPPAPPPKRPSQSGPPALPPAPPPKRISQMSQAIRSPPPLETAEKLAVRVDSAYADWMQDFASVAALAPSAESSADESPPPPPPPKQPRAIAYKPQLKAPPPPSAASSSSDLRHIAKALPGAVAWLQFTSIALGWIKQPVTG